MNPVERIRKIFYTAEPVLVLADEENPEIMDLCKKQNLEYGVYQEVDFDCYSSDIAEWELEEIAGADPAYIMFTSGSTGIPKGVVISQRFFPLEERDIPRNY